jgi:ADP-ribose pyrophosphatase
MTDPDGPAAASTGPGGSAAPSSDLTERVVGSRVLHKGHYLEFRVDTIERADGTRGQRDVVGHPGAVAIIALDEAGRVLLVRQFRVATRSVLLEIPAGTLDVDESGEVEDAEVASRRELEEETGYRARSWRKLGSFWTAPGFATELMHLYLATDLEPAHEGRLGPDEDEHLELERILFADAVVAAERGEITDAKSLVGLFWVDRLRAGEPGLVPSAAPAPTQSR